MNTEPQYADDAHAGQPLTNQGLRARARGLRTLFERLGFQTENAAGYLKCVRQEEGRTTTLTAAARSRNRYLTQSISRRVHTGFIVSLLKDTPVQTRLLISNASSQSGWLTGFLQRRGRNTDLGDLGGRYAGFSIWASDPEWARGWLALNDVQSEITALLSDGSESDAQMRHTLSWQPGSTAGSLAFTPQQVPSNLSEDILNDWLDRTERIVRLAERNPPTAKAEPTWLARQVEQGRLTLVLIGLLVGAPLVMAFALVAALTVLGLLLKLAA